jgi:GT2 family glycosyltransferase
VSIAVISHNRRAMLERCLTSIEKSQGRERYQLIVVDNGSADGSGQLDAEFPAVQWVRLPKNFGLTKAMNLGWRAADAEYVLFLHDDTELPPEAVSALADLLDANPDAAAVCPLLVDGAGKPGPQLGTLPPSGKWTAAQPSNDEPFAVMYPRAAALMVRVFYIKAVRQIDERFGQFGGDADLAAQIKRAARKILLAPAVKVRHHGSSDHSTAERADMKLARVAFLDKYSGFMAGLQARLGAIFGAVFTLKIGEASRLISGTKIDGA